MLAPPPREPQLGAVGTGAAPPPRRPGPPPGGRGGGGGGVAPPRAGGAPGGGPLGMAPGAMILPVRLAGDTPRAEPAEQARAIDVAASAGATVIALGSLVDLRDPLVQAAV